MISNAEGFARAVDERGAAEALVAADTEQRLKESEERVLADVVSSEEYSDAARLAAAALLVLNSDLPCSVDKLLRRKESSAVLEAKPIPAVSGDGWPAWFSDSEVDDILYCSNAFVAKEKASILIGVTDQSNYGTGGVGRAVTRVTVQIGPFSKTLQAAR